MTDWKYLTLERSGRVLTVSFDTGSTVNSMNNALLRELTQLAHELQQDSELNAIILTGRADMFTGGMDLKDPELAASRDASMAHKRTLLKLGPALCAAWEALEPVTIVAIEGWCVGGGMALAVACDWRVAADDAQLYVPELKLGMNMSWHSVPRFVNLVGPARAKQLLILAKPHSAPDMSQWGLVDFLAGPGESLNRAHELALEVAAMPPIPVRMAKRAITEAATVLNHATSFMDLDQFQVLHGSEDAREGAQAFFEKREADFKGN